MTSDGDKCRDPVITYLPRYFVVGLRDLNGLNPGWLDPKQQIGMPQYACIYGCSSRWRLQWLQAIRVSCGLYCDAEPDTSF